jgi:hypothetical protein
MDEWVVRGGIADAPRLIAGYVRHLGYPNQQVYGCSVQYQPGMSIADLAKAGLFPNAQISYAQRTSLESALAPLGYTMELRPTYGIGYHHTFMVLYDQTKALLIALPHDAALALAGVFQQLQNPHRVRRP